MKNTRPRWIFWLALLGACWALLPTAAQAQPDDRFPSEIAEYPDLVFPKEMREWGTPSREGNDIFKPAGAGPFPAVVIAHTCGGIEAHLFEHAQTLLEAGYVVLMLDSYTVRNHYNRCRAGGVKVTRFYKDNFDALQHLRKMPGIDVNRIYLVGFSMGSFAAAMVGSPRVAELSGSPHRFTASVGWYGNCQYPRFRGGVDWRVVRQDIDRPVMLLMAGNDTETAIDGCPEILQDLKSRGAPVQWHVYERATHAFDKDNAYRGYQRNGEVTADAMKRTLAFLERWR